MAPNALIVTTQRNEGAFLLEWIAHHLAVGFDHVLAFSNDCEDGSDAMLDRLADLGHVTHVRNPGPWKKGPQWDALARADKHPLVQAADWILVSDIDEFVNIKTNEGRLDDLWRALPDASAIAMSWRMFGNGGAVHFIDKSVVEQFRFCAPAVLNWPWRAVLFKTLFRNDGSYQKLGVHRPRSPDAARLPQQRWFDGAGDEMAASYATKGMFAPFGRDCYGLVQLNHYPLGAMESYIVKCDRGRANVEAEPFEMSYWVDRNFSDVEDRSIDRTAAARGAIMADLMADPVLAELHAGAVAWRHARFQTLMEQEPYRALFGRLLMCPPTRALSRDAAALILQHARA